MHDSGNGYEIRATVIVYRVMDLGLYTTRYRELFYWAIYSFSSTTSKTKRQYIAQVAKKEKFTHQK